MKPTGRPSKLTPEVQAKIINMIRRGNYRNVAAIWSGVGVRTLHEWMHIGKLKPKSKHGAFRQAVLEAEKDAEIRAVNMVLHAASKDPKHAQWWLERKFPQRWGRKDKTIIKAESNNQSNQGPLGVVILPKQDIEAAIVEAAKQKPTTSENKQQ